MLCFVLLVIFIRRLRQRRGAPRAPGRARPAAVAGGAGQSGIHICIYIYIYIYMIYIYIYIHDIYIYIYTHINVYVCVHRPLRRRARRPPRTSRGDNARLRPRWQQHRASRPWGSFLPGSSSLGPATRSSRRSPRCTCRRHPLRPPLPGPRATTALGRPRKVVAASSARATTALGRQRRSQLPAAQPRRGPSRTCPSVTTTSRP